MLRAIIILFLFFSFSSNSFGEQKTLTSEDLRKILEKNKIERSIPKNYKKSQGDKFKELAKNFRPFLIFVFIMIVVAISRSGKDEFKKEEEQVDDSSDSALQKAIKRFKKKKDKEDVKSKEEWKEIEEDRKEIFNQSLKIKVKKEKIENILSYVIQGKGDINIDTELLEKDDNQAKFSIYVFDITDSKNKIPLTSNSEGWHDKEYILSSSREMEVLDGYGYFSWTPIFYFPEFILVPPYKGKRKLEFKLYATSLDTKFSKGAPVVKNKKTKAGKTYLTISTEMEIEYDEPGYEEFKEYVDDVNERTVQLGLALANSDGHMDQREINIVKDWIDKQYHWSMFDYLLNFDDWKKGDKEKQNKEKIKFSFVLKNTYDQLKDNRLSMSEIIKDLNSKATRVQKYEAIQLLLNIAGSDEKLGLKEDQILNKTARALNLDIEHFQKMKNAAIANIETIEHSEQLNESVFNITESMSSAEKCKLLRKEYTRWNAQTNNTNENIRTKAKKMVELAAELRKKYKC